MFTNGLDYSGMPETPGNRRFRPDQEHDMKEFSMIKMTGIVHAVCRILAVGLSGIGLNAFCQDNLPNLDVPFEPTHPKVVDTMIELARIQKGDILYDLGCGDGRIPVAAAKQYGIRAVGIDIDPQRIREANENAELAGVTGLVDFVIDDIMNYDFSDATVVTLYLLDHINVELRPHLIRQLQPGTRVISHAFHMDYWEPDSIVTHPKARKKKIYCWIIPAKVGGEWLWDTELPAGASTWHLTLNQEFQGVVYDLHVSNDGLTARGGAVLRGREISLNTAYTVNNRQVQIHFQGLVHGDVIEGTQEWRYEKVITTLPWKAKRRPVHAAGVWRGKMQDRDHRFSDFTLRIQPGGNGMNHWLFQDRNNQYDDFPYYQWGASIWFEVNGSVYKGFIDNDMIEGYILSDENTHGVKWAASRH